VHLDCAETLGKEHGRVVRRKLETTTRLAKHLDWPGVAQVCRLTRTTLRKGVESVEIEYGITSVPRSLADAIKLLEWRRGHWGIENRSHYVRDVTMGEERLPGVDGVRPSGAGGLPERRDRLIAAAGRRQHRRGASAERGPGPQTPRVFDILKH
jgi:hypothetical protein